MNQKNITLSVKYSEYFLRFFLLILCLNSMTLSLSAFAQKNAQSQLSNEVEESNAGKNFSNKQFVQESPVWRTQISEVFFDSKESTQVLWELAIKELHDIDPTLIANDWERYSIQKMSLDETEFLIFKWLSNVPRESKELVDDLPFFGGKMHSLLMSKKGNKIVFKKKFDEQDEFYMPTTGGSLSNLKKYEESGDINWKNQCRKSNFRNGKSRKLLNYRECPEFARVLSGGGDAILFSVFIMSEQSLIYFCFDPHTAQLTSTVEFSGKNSHDELNFDPVKRTLYLESQGMNLLFDGTEKPMSARQIEAALAFSKSKLGLNYPQLRPCKLATCKFDLHRVVRRIDLSSRGQFEENINAKLTSNFLEENNSLYLSISDGLDDRIAELEHESWEFRASWINSYLGAFAAVREPQRIVNAWERIPRNIKKDIDPSDIALYWTTVGAEGLIRAFPSPLIRTYD